MLQSFGDWSVALIWHPLCCTHLEASGLQLCSSLAASVLLLLNCLSANTFESLCGAFLCNMHEACSRRVAMPHLSSIRCAACILLPLYVLSNRCAVFI